MTQEQILFSRNHIQVLQDDGADRSAHCRQPRYCRGHCADTFLILLAKINSVMEHEQPVKWLFRVLKNNAISEYRAQCRHAAAPLEESILRAAEPELIPFSGMLPKGLSASEQRILTMRLAEDMDYSTIRKTRHFRDRLPQPVQPRTAALRRTYGKE